MITVRGVGVQCTRAWSATPRNQRFQFQVPLDDFDVSQVTVIVTPSEIIVHAKTEAEKKAA